MFASPVAGLVRFRFGARSTGPNRESGFFERPAGRARFGERRVDVVTEGDFIARDARIEILEIAGNRVVVREIG